MHSTGQGYPQKRKKEKRHTTQHQTQVKYVFMTEQRHTLWDKRSDIVIRVQKNMSLWQNDDTHYEIRDWI